MDDRVLGVRQNGPIRYCRLLPNYNILRLVSRVTDWIAFNPSFTPHALVAQLTYTMETYVWYPNRIRSCLFLVDPQGIIKIITSWF